MCVWYFKCGSEHDVLTQNAHFHVLLSYCIVFVFVQYDKASVVEAKFNELEKEDISIKPSNQSLVCTLKNNTDLLACKAEYYHQCGEYQKCFELTSM